MVTQMADPSPSGILFVVEVDPISDVRWQEYVASHPDGLIYHHPAWLSVLKSEYGRTPIGLACVDASGQFAGVLPLLRTDGLPLLRAGRLTGRRLSSLPRTPVAGPLVRDNRVALSLVRAAIERIDEEPGTRLQLKVPAATLDGLVDDLIGTPWRSNFVLALPATVKELHFGSSRNHSRIRWAVNKATKSGVQVRVAETEADVRAWYALYLETMRWSCVPPRPYRLFKAMWEILNPHNLMRLYLAERWQGGESTLLAGSIFLMSGSRVFYAFNGWQRNARELRANDAVQWHAIHEATRGGFQYLDFGEVADSREGLAEFKAKWGGEVRPLYRYYYPSLGQPSRSRLEPGSYDPELVKRIWRHVPLRATARLGDWLYRRL